MRAYFVIRVPWSDRKRNKFDEISKQQRPLLSSPLDPNNGNQRRDYSFFLDHVRPRGPRGYTVFHVANIYTLRVYSQGKRFLRKHQRPTKFSKRRELSRALIFTANRSTVRNFASSSRQTAAPPLLSFAHFSPPPPPRHRRELRSFNEFSTRSMNLSRITFFRSYAMIRLME